jgi:integrase
VGGQRTPSGDRAGRPTIAELAAAFWAHAKSYYKRPDGTRTAEVSEYRLTIRALRPLYGKLPIAQFTPLCLKAVRSIMVHGYEHAKRGRQPALARNVVNKRIDRLRHLFAWGVQEGMVDIATLQALETVPGLQAGRSGARETAPVRPVARSVVEATLPALRPMLADMVRLLTETGMRAGEICLMRGVRHRHNGFGVALPARVSQTVVEGQGSRYRTRAEVPGHRSPASDDGHASLPFQPGTHARRAERRTPPGSENPLYPSHVKHMEAKRSKKPTRPPGARYTSTALDRALYAALKKANRGKPEADRLPFWHLHQLRHLRSLELKREVGLDVARAVLGHADGKMTERYAGLDEAAAVQAMARRGQIFFKIFRPRNQTIPGGFYLTTPHRDRIRIDRKMLQCLE